MRQLYTFCLLLTTILISFGCTEGEDSNEFVETIETDETIETSLNNFVNIGSTKFKIPDGILLNCGEDDGEYEDWQYEGYNYCIMLYSDQIERGEYIHELPFLVIGFDLFSFSSDGLDSDTYIISSTSPFTVGTFTDGDYRIDENDETSYTDIISGKIIVERNDNIYEITIDCTDENGLEITGYYKGELRYEVFSDDFDDEIEDSGSRLHRNGANSK